MQTRQPNNRGTEMKTFTALLALLLIAGALNSAFELVADYRDNLSTSLSKPYDA